MQADITIRPTTPSDTPILLEMTAATGQFKPLEIQALGEVLGDYHAEEQYEGHRCITAERAGRAVGFAYYAPTAMTEGAWHLYWIVVEKSLQGRGLGSILLGCVEDDIRRAGGRVIFIETSSLPHYDQTRRFYRKHEYEQEAVLRDCYACGDDMVVFRKALSGA